MGVSTNAILFYGYCWDDQIEEFDWDEWEDKLEGLAVDVNTHCSGDYPIPYLAIGESRKVARRGYPEEVKSLEVGLMWDATLTKAAEKLGIKMPQPEPRWWLVSDWH